jgi:hypothetical protein
MAHDAGYDAFMTGLVFFNCCKVININIKSVLKNIKYASIHKNKIP